MRQKSYDWGEPQRAPQLRVDSDFRDWRYIYIYINRASDHLALCPWRSKPKSRANPVLRQCLPLALNDNDFLSKGCLCKSPVFCFFTHCIGCSAALWDKLDLDFFRRAFCLSLPFFHAQEIDDWGPKFRFRLWWPLIDWLLSVVFGEGARKHWENNQREESNPQRRNGRVRTLGGHHFRLLSTGPCLYCVTMHCLASSQRSLTSPRKGTTWFPSTKTERAVQGSPHNACIRLVYTKGCTKGTVVRLNQRPAKRRMLDWRLFRSQTGKFFCVQSEKTSSGETFGMSVNTKMEHRTLAWALVITGTRVHLSESVSRKDSERKMF